MEIVKGKNEDKSYTNFIIDEIPNLLQIVGLPSIFGVVASKTNIFKLFIPPVVAFLLVMYLTHKSGKYLKSGHFTERWKFKLLCTYSLCGIISFLIIISSQY